MSAAGCNVLAVDDDPAIRMLLRKMLGEAGHNVETVGTGTDAMARLGDGFHGVVVLDIDLPDCQGSDLLPKIRDVAPGAPVLFLTGRGSVDLALDTLEGGAFDFIDKRQLRRRLLPAVAAASETLGAAMPTRGSEGPFSEIIARSRTMGEVFRVLEKALDSRIPVLVLGESGTGKELIAQALHKGGPRSRGELIAVNCAGIPENLLEAELFGYEKGAFTGAAQRKLGRFDLARGGTLFLDEIGEMPQPLQAKLLRVLQTGEYQRVGGVQTLRADVRVVSATHRDLIGEVEAGRFREDLYYRLAVFTVELPALKDRPGDIPLLVQHFLETAAAREGRRVDSIDPIALDVLEGFHWPGNVRQLENVLSYAVVHANSSAIGLGDLPRTFLREAGMARRKDGAEPVEPAAATEVAHTPETFPTLKQLEAKHIAKALELAKGNKAQAARLLGVSRMTLYRKLEDDAEEQP